MQCAQRAFDLRKSGLAICAAALLVSTGCQNIRHILREDRAGVLPAAKQLTVMSYNIRVGYGSKDRGADPYLLTQKEENLPPIVAAIQSIDPDIVGLQEVRGFEQARRLAKALDMNFAYSWHETDNDRPRWWGVAILSKYPILKTERIQIRSEKGNTKSALICTTEIGDRPATFISMHTARDLEDTSSFKGIMRAVDEIESPIVLIGDLNMDPDDRRLEILQPRFVDSALAVDTESAREARDTGTYPGFGRIDYVLVDSRYFEVQDAGIISPEHREASDHLAYYARIILKPFP